MNIEIDQDDGWSRDGEEVLAFLTLVFLTKGAPECCLGWEIE